MKWFSVESAGLSVPKDWKDDPTRVVKVGWKGGSITGFNQSSRRCYVFPVLTPSGVGVTNERSTNDHPFHQSITVGNDYFFTYQTSAAGQFEDPPMCFYSNEVDMRGRGEGRIICTAQNECTELSEDHLEMIMRMQWQGPEEGYSPKYRRVVAEEMRTISVFPGEVANIIDVRSQLRPTMWDLRLGPSRHGYFTIRVADFLRPNANAGANLVDSEGREGEDVIWQHSDWVDYYGKNSEGKTVGMAVFQFPSMGNVAWYAATYGSIRVNPFRKGGTFVCRGEEVDVAVRVVAHDGDPFEAKISELYDVFKEETAL